MSLLGYRGRLICPVKIGIARIDTATMASNNDYDDVFKVPTRTKTFGARGEKVDGRREFDEVIIPAQVEVINIAKQRTGPNGNVPDYRVSYVLHYEDIERLSLVDATTGKPLFGVNDRITALYDYDTETLVRQFTKPEIFVTEAQDAGIGFAGQRNLLILVTDDRPQGLAEVP